MPSTYLITNQDKVFVYPVSSGLVFPGNPNSSPPTFNWFNVKESILIGRAGFLWDGGTKINYYHVPISDFQAELISSFLDSVSLADAWEQAKGSAKTAVQLLIDTDFFQSLENDLELYVLDRLQLNNGLTAKQLAEELSVEEKIAQRGLEKLADERNLVSFWSRERTYKVTSEGTNRLLQFGWTPENTSESFPVLPTIEPCLPEKETVTVLQDKPSAKKITKHNLNVVEALSMQFETYSILKNGALVANIRSLCNVSIIQAHHMIASFAEQKQIPPYRIDKNFLDSEIGDSCVPIRDIRDALIAEKAAGVSDTRLVRRAISKLEKTISAAYVHILLKHFRASGVI